MLTTVGGLGIVNLRTLAVQKVGTWDDTWAVCAVDPGESRVVLGSDKGGGLSLAGIDNGAEAGVLRRSGPGITSCAYSPDGRRVAVSFEDGTIGLWGDLPRANAQAHDGIDPSCPGNRTGYRL